MYFRRSNLKHHKSQVWSVSCFTPPKTYMDTQNDGLEKVVLFSMAVFGIYVKFLGYILSNCHNFAASSFMVLKRWLALWRCFECWWSELDEPGHQQHKRWRKKISGIFLNGWMIYREKHRGISFDFPWISPQDPRGIRSWCELALYVQAIGCCRDSWCDPKEKTPVVWLEVKGKDYIMIPECAGCIRYDDDWFTVQLYHRSR